MKKIAHTLLIVLSCFSICAMAHEPANLAIAKKKVIEYHDTGAYEKDLNQALHYATAYLKSRLANPASFNGKKPAMVLDIDETSLSNYPYLLYRDFGGSIEDIRHDEDLGKDKAIAPMLTLYRFAKANQVAVFFLTGRFEAERELTEENLKKAGYSDWNGLILRDRANAHTSAEIYKSAVRKQLREKGYDIVLNIGDQQSDLSGGYADKNVKLPNPYYFIP